MWDVLAFFGMDLTRILQSCEFVKVDPPTVPTVIVIVVVLLFSLGAKGRSYMDVAPLSATPKCLSLFFFK